MHKEVTKTRYVVEQQEVYNRPLAEYIEYLQGLLSEIPQQCREETMIKFTAECHYDEYAPYCEAYFEIYLGRG